MKRSSVVWIVVIIVVVILAGGIWYWSSTMGAQNAGNTNSGNTATTTTNGNTNTAGTPAAVAPAPAPTSVVILNSESTTTLGTYLAATNGMTLYLYTKDKARVSNCTGVCATIWPPYTVSATAAKSLLGSTPGITGAIGTITRADGTIQVTYNNLPLYFYEKDQIVGDAKGQNLGGFVIVNL